MRQVPFVKYEGLGNDFLVVDRLREGALGTPAEAAWLCDRHFGVGGDGVLTLLPSSTADLRMHIFNADGSEAEMCGNGIRCVAKHVVDAGLVPGDEVRIETAAGLRVCRVERGPDGLVALVAVQMGRPVLEAAEVPTAGEGRQVAVPTPVLERSFAVTAVSMGNPHAVIFDAGVTDAERAARYGRALENDLQRFPRRTNVEFVERRGAALHVIVWERGSGLTLACGTGACATAVAATLLGHAREGEAVQVVLPGGPLSITVAPGLTGVTMVGPARRVFAGVAEVP